MLYDENVEKKRIKLNTIYLSGFGNVKVGDILYYSINMESGFIKGIKHLLCLGYKEACKTIYDIEKHGNGETIALLSASCTGRKDHYNAFSNATGIAKNRISVKPGVPKWCFFGVRYLKKLPRWNRELKNVEADFGTRMFYLRILFQVYVDYCYIMRNIKKMTIKPKYFVSWCDVMPVDSYFVQRLNNEGIITVTLQHGMFSLLTNPWPIRGAKSNYFLTQCQQTADELDSVYYPGKAIVVGSPHQFSQLEITCKGSYAKEIFGVFMNTSSVKELDEQNRIMFITVQDYCKKKNKKLIIKYHPTNNPENYDRLIDYNVVLNAYKEEIGVNQFLEMIDVAVSGNSTTFTTALAADKPSLLFFRKHKDVCIYRNTVDIQFETVNELEKIVERIDEKFVDRMKELNSYFNVKGKISVNYAEVYKMIGIN